MAGIESLLRKVRKILVSRGVSSDDADDLVHDAFVRVEAYEKVATVRSREAVVVRAAVNLSIDRARRRGHAPFVHPDIDIGTITDPLPRPDEVAIARARLHRVSEGLTRLNEKSRRILLNRRLEGLSVAQIAENEGMTVAAVEKQLARATLNLMKWAEGW